MRVWSDAFAEGQPIPRRFCRDGENLSPPLKWRDVPPKARELALIFESVDSQRPFQWIVYGIDPGSNTLEEGFRHRRKPDGGRGLRQGANDVGNLGYDGPQGPAGRTHRYRFRLLALDRPLDLDAGADGRTLSSAADGHVIEEADLDATYERRG